MWTGSTNFTDDAWTRPENNVITIADHAMATAYQADFQQMWTTGSVSGAGRGLGGTSRVGADTLGWDFSPGDGSAISAALVDRVNAATSRLLIGAMVLTSHPLLAALASAVDRGVPLTGVYDSGQMDPIVDRWRNSAGTAAVLADWTKVSNLLSAKPSTPYTPTSVHDFMHLKVVVADDVVVTGSYNFSADAAHNAENQIHLDDPATVNAYVGYLVAVTQTYAAAVG